MKNINISVDTEEKASAFLCGISANPKFGTKLGYRQSDHAILTDEDMQCLKNRTQRLLTWLPLESDHLLSVPSTWETKQLLALVTLALD